MTVFDLFFIVVFFGSVGTFVSVVIASIRGRRTQAVARLRWLGIFVAAYFAIVVLVSLVSPQRVLNVGDDRCWDDWCIAVTNVHTTLGNQVASRSITFRLSSRAGRVAQRERGLVVYLVDSRGRRFDPVAPDAAAVPFDVMLQPRESVNTTRLFETSGDAYDLGLVVRHGAVGYQFPGCCIIGEDASLLHKRTIVHID
jgi:hypothetical protein